MMEMGHCRRVGDIFEFGGDEYKVVATKLVEMKDGDDEVRIHAKEMSGDREMKFNVPL